MAAKDEITKIARELCRKHPDAPARTLAKRLVAETNGALTIETARSRVRSVFGVAGKKHRKYAPNGDKSIFRKLRKAGVSYSMPSSKADSGQSSG